MNGPIDPHFHDRVLRMLCILDGVGYTAGPMRQRIKTWHRGGAENRHLRIYTQKSAWKQYADDYPNAVNRSAPGGAKEWEQDGFTLLYAPLPFWQQIAPNATDGTAHQIFPAYFVEHAVRRSGFAP